MNASQTKVLQYLDEAYATERTLVSVLSEQIAMTPRGSYRNALETHLRETRDHARPRRPPAQGAGRRLGPAELRGRPGRDRDRSGARHRQVADRPAARARAARR